MGCHGFRGDPTSRLSLAPVTPIMCFPNTSGRVQLQQQDAWTCRGRSWSQPTTGDPDRTDRQISSRSTKCPLGPVSEPAKKSEFCFGAKVVWALVRRVRPLFPQCSRKNKFSNGRHSRVRHHGSLLLDEIYQSRRPKRGLRRGYSNMMENLTETRYRI